MISQGIEQGLIQKLQGLKYIYCSDIRDCAPLEQNFRRNFEVPNHVQHHGCRVKKPVDSTAIPEAYRASRMLRKLNSHQLGTLLRTAHHIIIH